MTSKEFCYWLQGLYELGNPVILNEHQTQTIKRHLNMVFVHEIQPALDKSLPASMQGADSDLPSHMTNGVGGILARC